MGADLESRERAAKKACLLGDVDKGAEILADLYVDTDVGRSTSIRLQSHEEARRHRFRNIRRW